MELLRCGKQSNKVPIVICSVLRSLSEMTKMLQLIQFVLLGIFKAAILLLLAAHLTNRYVFLEIHRRILPPKSKVNWWSNRRGQRLRFRWKIPNLRKHSSNSSKNWKCWEQISKHNNQQPMCRVKIHSNSRALSKEIILIWRALMVRHSSNQTAECWANWDGGSNWSNFNSSRVRAKASQNTPNDQYL